MRTTSVDHGLSRFFFSHGFHTRPHPVSFPSPSSFSHAALPHGRILAAFSLYEHSPTPLFLHTAAFWQLLLSPHFPTPPLRPVLAHGRILAAFALSYHSPTPLFSHTVAFWQISLSDLAPSFILVAFHLFARWYFASFDYRGVFFNGYPFLKLLQFCRALYLPSNLKFVGIKILGEYNH